MLFRSHIAPLASIRQMSRHVSHSSADDFQADEHAGVAGLTGDYKADEQAGVAGLTGDYQADEQAGVARLSWRVSGR